MKMMNHLGSEGSGCTTCLRRDQQVHLRSFRPHQTRQRWEDYHQRWEGRFRPEIDQNLFAENVWNLLDDHEAHSGEQTGDTLG